MADDMDMGFDESAEQQLVVDPAGAVARTASENTFFSQYTSRFGTNFDTNTLKWLCYGKAMTRRVRKRTAVHYKQTRDGEEAL